MKPWKIDSVYSNEAVRQVFAEVVHVIERAREWPAMAPRVELPEIDELSVEVRKATTRGFPYGIVYLVTDDVLWIVAIAHGKRRPNYWRAQLK